MLKSSVIAVAMLLSISAAKADDLDFSKVKCGDFISSPKDQIAIILAWLEGYYTKENDPPVIYSDKMNKDAKNLGAYCAEHKDDNIIKAAEAVMPVK